MGQTLDRAESTETGLYKVVTHPRHGIVWDNGGTDLIQEGAEGCQDQIMCDRPLQGLDRHGAVYDKFRTDTEQDEIRRADPRNMWDR